MRSISMRFADVMVFLLIAISLVGCSTGSGAGSNKEQPPVASTGGPYTGHIGSAIGFNASGSSDPQGEPLTSYAWNFGDGTTGNRVSPNHTYTAAGAYSVSLTVTNSANLSSSATTTASITAQAPVPNAGGPYTAGPNVAVTFNGSGSTDPQGEALTYAWNFGDGATGHGVSPTHTYAATGNYAVSLTVTDSTNLSSTATATAAIETTGPALSGTVQSGTQPVSAAHVH